MGSRRARAAATGLTAAVLACLSLLASVGVWAAGDAQASVANPVSTLTSAGLPLAVSGDTLVAGTSVFVNSAAGAWSNTVPAATLAQAGSTIQDRAVAVSGGVIAATELDAALVYVRPSGGWSGMTEPAATLALPSYTSALLFSAPAISGHTIYVAAGWEPADGRAQQAVFVFKEPARGWSGTLRPSAELIARGGPGFSVESLQTLTVAGTDVYVAANIYAPSTHPATVAYVFSQPRRGWSGRSGQTGTLTADCVASGATPVVLAASGTTVAVDCGSARTDEGHELVAIYSRPRHGWSSHTSPSGSLAFDPESGDASADSLAVTERDVVVLTAGESSQGPAGGQVFAATEPDRGWQGFSEVARRPLVSEPGYASAGLIALNDNDLFVEDAYDATVDVFGAADGDGRMNW